MVAPVAVIDSNGITIPLYTDVLAYLQEQYQLIYGSDVNLDPDTQDGQWIAVTASAIHDANQTMVAAYLSYSPTFAQGVGLSSIVKINGIRRQRPSVSNVIVQCVGVAGTGIGGGIVGDQFNLGTQWVLPPEVTIPPTGLIEVTATSNVEGAVTADVNTLTHILTPIPGWQTVTNPSAAVPGQPIETDAALRRRQTISVANPSQTVVVGIQGAIEELAGVVRVMVYENPTAVTDVNGTPPYSMAIAVEGGDINDIANAIALRKTPGSPTYGTTSVMVFDSRGIPSVINFFELTIVPVTVGITLNALPGFTSVIETEIIDSVIAYMNSLPIGYDSYQSKLVAACQVPEPDGLTYDVTSVRQSRDGNPLAIQDVTISYIEAATADPTTVTITVNPQLRR
jgi:uncharacterized phage protein gp47/JayE